MSKRYFCLGASFCLLQLFKKLAFSFKKVVNFANSCPFLLSLGKNEILKILEYFANYFRKVLNCFTHVIVFLAMLEIYHIRPANSDIMFPSSHLNSDDHLKNHISNWITQIEDLDNSFYFIYNHDNMSKMALAENFKSSHSRKIRMD